MKNKSFERKSALCFLLLLSLLAFVPFACADNYGCEYTIVNGVLTIGTGTACTLNSPSWLGSDTPDWINDTTITKVCILPGVATGTSAQYLFYGLENAAVWEGLEELIVSTTTNMDSMFYNCNKLTSLDALENWNVSSVTAMRAMFFGCSELTSLSKLENWKGKLTNVTNMSLMFKNCSKLANLDGLENWNVSSVTNMTEMFYGCSELTSLSKLDNWKDKLTKLMYMKSMFYNCSKLTNLDGLENWDVSNVTSMIQMFYGCSEVKKADFSNWDLPSSDSYFTSEMLKDVDGAAVKLKQYYTGMLGTNLYVYGKHSYTELTGAESTDTNLIFEPYSVAVSFTGGTGSTSFTPASTRTDAKTYYDTVHAAFSDVPAYDAVNGAYYQAGDTIVMSFNPDNGAQIESVTATDKDGNQTTLTSPYKLENIQSNYTVEVKLQQAVATYTLFFAKPADVDGPLPAAMPVTAGSDVTLPGQGDLSKLGAYFAGWSDGTTTYTTTYTMPAYDVTLTAQFNDGASFTITYEYGDAESGTVPAPQTNIPADTVVSLRSNDGGLSKEGYEFSVWSDGINTYAPGASFLMPAENVTLRPVFEKVPDPLPEDEIGTYYYNESGQKEYVQFHNYDICMNYMGDDNLCRNTSANLYN